MSLNSEPNPIGTAYTSRQIEQKINDLKKAWDELSLGRPRWWQFKNPVNLKKVHAFILDQVDELINFVEDQIDLGPDKKATVMRMVENVYDYGAKEIMPIWLKPLSPAIKNVTMDAVSLAIDFMVGKYRDGSWRDHRK